MREGSTPTTTQSSSSAENRAVQELLVRLREATIGVYDIHGELGRGGMATVFLAHEISLDRKVAIKVMSPAMVHGEGIVERFKREARTAANLSHPSILLRPEKKGPLSRPPSFQHAAISYQHPASV